MLKYALALGDYIECCLTVYAWWLFGGLIPNFQDCNYDKASKEWQVLSVRNGETIGNFLLLKKKATKQIHICMSVRVLDPACECVTNSKSAKMELVGEVLETEKARPSR